MVTQFPSKVFFIVCLLILSFVVEVAISSLPQGTVGLSPLYGSPSLAAQQENLEIGGLRMIGKSPTFATATVIKRAVQKVESFLEWDVRRTPMSWVATAAEFQAKHGMGPAVLAYTRKQGNQSEIVMGPGVTDTNFEATLAHELVHVVLAQKFKTAVPQWLEEGLANYVSRRGQLKPSDYREMGAEIDRGTLVSAYQLTHPFNGAMEPAKHYRQSTALAEMIASKCDLKDLLQLAVGSRLENYLKTTCEIPDLDVALRAWIRRKARG